MTLGMEVCVNNTLEEYNIWVIWLCLTVEGRLQGTSLNFECCILAKQSLSIIGNYNSFTTKSHRMNEMGDIAVI